MKLLVEVFDKKNLFVDKVDGIILPLEGFSVESVTFFNLEEIKEIASNSSYEVFVKLNKNFMNEDIDSLKQVLIELEQCSIKGVFFYDLAVLELKRELSLSLDLVWNQTHMVNNYRTCNYYFQKGVKYALLGKEITLDEIDEIIDKSDIVSMVEVVSKPSVAFSKRKLLSNYYHDLGMEKRGELIVQEKVTSDAYRVVEDDNGTSFFFDCITNGTSIIQHLFQKKCSYIIMREYGIESNVFSTLVYDTMDYIKNDCKDLDYINKYKKLGDSTNFFFKKTIYKVKK